MLLSILALNSQQKYLLKINSVTTQPIHLEETKKVDENIVERNGELFKVAPDPAGPQ